MANVKSFTFFASYYEALMFLEEADRAKMLVAICEYALLGKEPEFDNPVLNGYWQLMLPTLSLSVKRSMAGHEALGKSKIKANKKQIKSKIEANKKQNKSKTETTPSLSLSLSNKHDDENNNINNNHPVKDNINNNNPLKPPMKNDAALWKEDRSVYEAMLDEAKARLLADEEYRRRKEELHQNIDFVHTVENCYDYWKSDTGYAKCKNARTKSINLLSRLQNSFDKGRIYKPKERKEEAPPQEVSLQERHSNFVVWLASLFPSEERPKVMPVFHVSFRDFTEMLRACGNDASKMAGVVKQLLKRRITPEEGLIGAFRKYMEEEK